MLLLGNSLLLEGVDYPSLRNALAQKYDVHRLVIEQTEYLDQYYLLRTLFREGSRPHDVVLCASVNHLIGDENRGDFMARYMDGIDIISLSRRKRLDATTTSSYLFAHWSEWFANRAELRNVLLGHTMPDMGDLTVVLGWRPAPKVTAEDVQLKAAPRLKELKALCDTYGSRLTILIPPSLKEDYAGVIEQLGSEMEIRVLVPEPAGAMASSLFHDGFHLAPTGAAVFTAKLEAEF